MINDIFALNKLCNLFYKIAQEKKDYEILETDPDKEYYIINQFSPA